MTDGAVEEVIARSRQEVDQPGLLARTHFPTGTCSKCASSRITAALSRSTSLPSSAATSSTIIDR
jgi:hypothetical protein